MVVFNFIFGCFMTEYGHISDELYFQMGCFMIKSERAAFVSSPEPMAHR